MTPAEHAAAYVLWVQAQMLDAREQC
eukprot:SAG31_NODE_10542_length_1126_cov_1.765336_2_plen_25_part_01